MAQQTVLQFSDLHLFTDRTRRLKNVPTWDSLVAVFEHARRQVSRPDLVVITGDLAHDEEPTTYLALRELLGTWLPVCRLLPGNHDNRHGIRAAFPELFPQPWGTTRIDPMSPLGFSLPLGEWRLLGLDTHLPGQVQGRLWPTQRDWLRTQLQAFPHTPTMLFQHHPPMPVGTSWLDELRLENPTDLQETLAGAAQVAALLTGHVHQEGEYSWGQLRVLTVPATAVQFAPGTARLTVDQRPPGYRVIRLDGTSWTTHVERLESIAYPASDS